MLKENESRIRRQILRLESDLHAQRGFTANLRSGAIRRRFRAGVGVFCHFFCNTSDVTKIETAIERLHEYRAALITASVTAEIDVGGAVVHEEDTA